MSALLDNLMEHCPACAAQMEAAEVDGHPVWICTGEGCDVKIPCVVAQPAP